ncbi:MAG TPA: alpha/beta fold hydrolase [Anaeromyxobacter sp.]|nr:alpha/beta fold hydrolase [Anaeromyxobacter sp.]
MDPLAVATSQRPDARPKVVPAPLRAAVSVASALAPGLAARGLAELCMRPPRHRAPDHERAALRGAEPFEARHAGGVVRGWRRGQGPAVLLLHGWGGRAGQLARFGEALAAAGCTAVAIDAPAHGSSSGKVASVPLYAKAIAAAAREAGARAAVGHSFGGAALTFAVANGLELDAAVLVGAPATPVQYVDEFCNAFGLGARARAELRKVLEARVGHRYEELELVRVIRSARAPALVIHDRDDREVSHASGEALAAAWPGARLHLTRGLGHRRILRDAAVAQEIARFVAERLA